MKKVLPVLAAAAVLAVGFGAQAAPAGVQIGVLTCNVSSGVGLVVGSSRDLSCTFRSSDSTEDYHGKITNMGVDIGIHGGGQLTWAVFAPARMAPGSLAGNYGGVNGGVSAGAGASANVLVGGSENGISLQPVSVASETGVNVSGGITGISLTYGD
jgi:hypothetical protein